MILSGGWRCTARVHARATGTWSCSSRPSRIPAGPSAWLSRSEAAARFAASRTSLPAGPASLSDGTDCPRSASAAARDHGSRRPATAYCRSTTAIPENGPPARYQPERGTSPGRAKGRRTHARVRGRGCPSICLFHRASRGLRAQRATLRVLAEGDPDVDAALASAVSCPPPPRSLTPPRPPLPDERGRAARLRRCPDCPEAATRAVPSALLMTAAWRRERQRRRARSRRPRLPQLGQGRSERSGSRSLLVLSNCGDFGVNQDTRVALSSPVRAQEPLCPYGTLCVSRVRFGERVPGRTGD